MNTSYHWPTLRRNTFKKFLIINSLVILVLFSCICLFGHRYTFAEMSTDWSYSPLDIQIKMGKNMAEVDQPLDGKVVVKNVYPSNLPAVFNIQLFHNEEFVNEFRTTFDSIPPGTTEFSFKEFGIPQFTFDPDAEGEWRISILQQGMEESKAVEATVHVAPSLKTKTPHPEGAVNATW